MCYVVGEYRMSQRNCSHKWMRVLVNSLPAYRCRHCGATVFESLVDETLTQRELRSPKDVILGTPDFGAPCISYNLKQKIQDELKRRVVRR